MSVRATIVFAVILTALAAARAANASAASAFEVFVPLVWGNADLSTGIAISNTGGTPASLVFEYYSPGGNLVVPAVIWDSNHLPGKPGPLLPGEQRALIDWEILGLQPLHERLGWLLVRSDSPDLQLVYQFFTAGLDRLDGMNGVEQLSSHLYFPWVLHGPEAYRGTAAETRISVANPSNVSVSVTCSLLMQTGTARAQATRTLSPNGLFSQPVSELFPEISDWNGLSLMVAASSGPGIVACELLTIGGPASPSFIVSNGFAPETGAGPLYSAQAAQAGGLRTMVRLMNTSALPVSATLRLKLSDGLPAGSARQVTIESKGFVQMDLADLFGISDGTVGTLEVVPGGAGVVGTVVFGDPAKGYAAALPLQRQATKDLFFPHVASLQPGPGHAGMFTGLAIHAPGESGVQGTIEVLDHDGVPTGVNDFALAPGARLSKLIAELVTIPEQAGGYVRIRGNGDPLVAQELFGDGALRMLSAVPAFESSGYDPLAVPTTPYIVVDQFGYLPNSEKIAVIRDPVTGFDAAEAFTPGITYAVVNARNGRHVFTGPVTIWNKGSEDASSGDRAWWFDFSAVKTPGDYYVMDVEKHLRSFAFQIAPNVYHDVLRHAVRTFFYQRAGFAKQAPYADTGWVDGASHLGPLQDANCRLYNRPGDLSTERDLRGGWFDAGDYNKYTNWTAEYVIELLRAFEQAPEAFTDDFGIPESGNGISDIVDEAKWGMDWLVRMQDPDGSVLSIMGLSHASPPSAATRQSLYGSPSTSATLSTAAAYAYGATVLGSLGKPAFQAYAADLATRAEKAWNWAVQNPSVVFRNNDSASGTSGLGAGQQETDNYGRLVKKLEAAVYLFELTGKSVYRDFVDGNYASVNMIQWSYVFPFQARNQEMLLYYASLPGATPDVANRIKQVYASGVESNDNLQAFRNNRDPYLAYMKDYTWGSNSVKCRQAGIFLNLIDYAVTPASHADAWRAAEHYVHYIHGVNPLGIVYLSNMYGAGGEKTVNEFYHTWFANGSQKWDRVGTSTYGPAPGFLTGGPNPSYNWDGCCPSGCGSSSNNAQCNSEPISPPKGQPAQKSYKDFNTSWPLNSWAVTENSCGYQVAYIRLLSRFVGK